MRLLGVERDGMGLVIERLATAGKSKDRLSLAKRAAGFILERALTADEIHSLRNSSQYTRLGERVFCTHEPGLRGTMVFSGPNERSVEVTQTGVQGTSARIVYIDERRKKAVERVAEEARVAEAATWRSGSSDRPKRRQSSLWGDYSSW